MRVMVQGARRAMAVQPSVPSGSAVSIWKGTLGTLAVRVGSALNASNSRTISGRAAAPCVRPMSQA